MLKTIRFKKQYFLLPLVKKKKKKRKKKKQKYKLQPLSLAIVILGVKLLLF